MRGEACLTYDRNDFCGMVRFHDKHIDGPLTRGVRYGMISRDLGSVITREQHAEQ